MLSLRRCREKLGSACSLSDGEVEQLRDQLYSLANLTLDLLDGNQQSSVEKEMNEKTCELVASPLSHGISTFPEDTRIEFEERAAIMEHEGGLLKDEAEVAALNSIVSRYIH